VDVTRDELAARLGEPGLNLLDVRTPEEYSGEAGYPSDPRQGHIPGARNVELAELLGCGPDEVRKLVSLPEGAEVIAYCHTGSRSALAVQLLRAAGYDARNYPGSWAEWSRDPSLPAGGG
jgi:thiosulfate/3-mercaptopyruvate sulfurtransferase